MNIFEKLKVYWKKIQRIKRIKKHKNKIPPYLKKDFGVELNYKIWITKGARFSASERNRICDNLSSQTVGYLSAYLIIVNLITIYKIDFLSKLFQDCCVRTLYTDNIGQYMAKTPYFFLFWSVYKDNMGEIFEG